ncbi:MAG TPA: hypothetical protein VK645_17475 [Chitinophagaceae bacterium]|nr:hypothetical protein [Chitinophagaceae bacterium]
MLKEAKNIDFYTTGKQPSDQDFLRISEWIRKNKEKGYTKKPAAKKKLRTQNSTYRKKNTI